jgi:hypothetical protein
MANPDFDELFKIILPFARQALSKYGELLPFGAIIDPDGKASCWGAYEGDEHPVDSKALLGMIAGSFRTMAKEGKVRATGICFYICVAPPGKTEETDSICICLEHESGEAVDIFVPYKKGWFGKIKYGDIFESYPGPKIFVKR